jgi:cardiolipin synthase A/B
LAQLWHRMVDTLGSTPVRLVRPLGTSAPPAASEPAFRDALAALTKVDLTPGHRIELLTDGTATLDRMKSDISSARRSVLFQSYYCDPGHVTEDIQRLLMAKAREGVLVLFLRDGFGCLSLGSEYLDSLTAAGVQVATVRPLRWYSFHKAQHRSHVRSIVIDGAVGYTGGFGLADQWLPSADGKPGWRDTSARVTGPAVEQLAGAFAIAWSEATGELLTGAGLFSRSNHDGMERDGALGGLLFTARTYGTPVPERYLALSLSAARHTVYITNPYFIPNRELMAWLKDAAGRGVDVRVLAPSGNTDVRLTRWAAHTRYEELLKAGVKIYEYQPAMLHAKTMVIDGVFSSIGSLNLDNVSLRINDEAELLVQDTTIGRALDSVFAADLEQSEPITLEQFRRRSILQRAKESFARILRDFL